MAHPEEGFYVWDIMEEKWCSYIPQLYNDQTGDNHRFHHFLTCFDNLMVITKEKNIRLFFRNFLSVRVALEYCYYKDTKEKRNVHIGFEEILEDSGMDGRFCWDNQQRIPSFPELYWPNILEKMKKFRGNLMNGEFRKK